MRKSSCFTVLELRGLTNFVTQITLCTVTLILPFIARGQDRCLDWMRERYLRANKVSIESQITSEALEQKSLSLFRNQRAKKESDPYSIEDFDKDVWAIGLVPILEAQEIASKKLVSWLLNYRKSDEQLREEGWQQEILDSLSGAERVAYFNRQYQQFDFFTLENYLQNSRSIDIKDVTNFSKKDVKFLQDAYGSMQNSAYEEQVKNQKLITAACVEISPLDTFNCKKAVSLLISEIKYISSTQTFFPHLYYQILRSPEYIDGMRLAGLTMLERTRNPIPESANIFDDLKAAFKTSGLSNAKAESAAWMVLAVSSNGAQNTARRAITFAYDGDFSPSFIGLALVSSMIGQIDLLKYQQGRQTMYSVPSQVVGSCRTTKFYHFWMYGYLSRYLVTKGFKKSTAVHAAFLVAKAYQVNRQIGKNRDAVESLIKVLKAPKFSALNQIIRTDLTYAAAGAVFGAHSERNMPGINLDLGLDTLIANSKDVKIEKTDEESKSLFSKIALFNKWTDLFAPNSVLQIYMN